MDVYLDGSAICSIEDVYDVLDRALDFGPYFGRNSDALWDSLTFDVARPLRLVWREHAKSRDALGVESFNQIVGVFDAVVEGDRSLATCSRFTYELA